MMTRLICILIALTAGCTLSHGDSPLDAGPVDAGVIEQDATCLTCEPPPPEDPPPVPACSDLQCDVVHCTICYLCPGVPPGTVTCKCAWWNTDPATWPTCTKDVTDPFIVTTP